MKSRLVPTTIRPIVEACRRLIGNLSRSVSRQPIPRWTLDDEFELISARRMHRATKHLTARKTAAIHAELKASSRWRGL